MIDNNKVDSLFIDAARIIINEKMASVSLLQRRLNLGYNWCGRIMDQLEVAGIVGTFNGAKVRDVLVPNLGELDQKLKEWGIQEE